MGKSNENYAEIFDALKSMPKGMKEEILMDKRHWKRWFIYVRKNLSIRLPKKRLMSYYDSLWF